MKPVRIVSTLSGVKLCNPDTHVTFGPLFGSFAHAQAFLDWLPQDARSYDERELGAKAIEWVAQTLKSKEDTA